jgi:single-strand DNA-binding protein
LCTGAENSSALVGAPHDACGMTRSDDTGSDNRVELRGRLAAAPLFRELPSGDVLALFRLTVPRPSSDRVRVDSIECTAARPRVHKTLSRADPGDELAVVGQLHRRFWRSPNGPASRYAVEVDTVKLTKAGRRGGASRDRTRASA